MRKIQPKVLLYIHLNAAPSPEVLGDVAVEILTNRSVAGRME